MLSGEENLSVSALSLSPNGPKPRRIHNLKGRHTAQRRAEVCSWRGGGDMDETQKCLQPTKKGPLRQGEASAPVLPWSHPWPSPRVRGRHNYQSYP